MTAYRPVDTPHECYKPLWALMTCDRF
jgi:hypothetical protein